MNPRKIAAAAVAAAAAAGSALLGAAYGIYRISFYHKPSPEVPAPGDMKSRLAYRDAMDADAAVLDNAPFEEVHLTAQDGTDLFGRYYHHRDGAPVVVLSTASPYKFPAAVLSALGQRVSDDEFAVMEDLHTSTGVPAPKNLASLREKPVRHTDVIDREDMLDYVLQKAGEKQW